MIPSVHPTAFFESFKPNSWSCHVETTFDHRFRASPRRHLDRRGQRPRFQLRSLLLRQQVLSQRMLRQDVLRKVPDLLQGVHEPQMREVAARI